MHGGVNVVLLREVRLDLPRPEVSSLHQVDALRVFTRLTSMRASGQQGDC